MQQADFNIESKRAPILLWSLIISLGVTSLMGIMLWSGFRQAVVDRENTARLYVRMVENSISRTIESVEISLLSLAEEIENRSRDEINFAELQKRVNQILRFAPHIRQIVLTSQQQVLLDSLASLGGAAIDFEKLGLSPQSRSSLSFGINIGQQIPSRFLPRLDQNPSLSDKRSHIPLALEVDNKQAEESYVLLAALNAAYFEDIFRSLDLQQQDHAGLYKYDGSELIAPWNNRGQFKQGISQLLMDGRDMTELSQQWGLLPVTYTVIWLLEKYPLAIVISVSHRSSFDQWLAKNILLILGLMSGTLVIILSALVLRRDYIKMALLQEQISLLFTAVHQSPVSVVITDSVGNIAYVNNQFEDSSGYSMAEVIGRNPRLLKTGETSAQEYQYLWDIISGGGIWYGDLHNRRKNGTLYWERARIAGVKNQQGEIINYIAIKEDITQLKQDEKQLRLASAVFETAAEAIVVTDSENCIQVINPAFSRITGFSRSEVVGKNPSVLSSGQHDKHFYDVLFETLSSSGSWEGEIWNRRKSGDIYPEWLRISTMRDEFGKLEGYVALFHDISKRKKSEEHIVHQANYDVLTGLANRKLFTERLTWALDRADREQDRVALLFIDLDRFKQVNDTRGHSFGDLLLQEVANRLLMNLRKTDTAARLGGDEFAVILPGLYKLQTLEALIGKLLLNLSQTYVLDGHEAFISASIGVTLFPDDGDTPEILLRNADSAMYQAKAKGRNDFQFFTQEIMEQSQKHGEMEQSLRNALERNELYLNFQPIIEMSSGRMVSAEALIRWQHPQKGLISPAEFIPLAEELGLIRPIGEWVLVEACRFAASWSEYSSSAPRVAVNLSSRQFERQNIVDVVQSILQQTGLPAERLTLEITESLMVATTSQIVAQLNGLRELGIEISIDDFGTGYSSLSYLKKLPLSCLKIDRSFVMDITTDPEDRLLVAAILSMAQSLNLKVIAEGVETTAQADFLKSKNCQFVQGYLYSRPLSKDDFITILKQQ